MRGTRWSLEDRQRAWNLRRSGKTLEQIGLALNRSVASVNTCLQAMKQEHQARKRPCLCCRKPFTSAGAHNRLCQACAHRSISPYAL